MIAILFMILLIIFICTILIDMRKSYLYSRNYHTGKNILLKELPLALDLLQKSNKDAQISLIYPLKRFNIIIIKMQNSEKCWFEIISKNKESNKVISKTYPKYFDKEFKKKKLVSDEQNQFNVFFDTNKIYSFILNIFSSTFEIDENSKISIWFKNTQTLKSFEEYSSSINSLQ